MSRRLRALLLGGLLAVAGAASAIDTEKPLPDPVRQAPHKSVNR